MHFKLKQSPWPAVELPTCVTLKDILSPETKLVVLSVPADILLELENCGLDEYVTKSQEEYIERAVYLANHPEELVGLKRKVRDAFVNGPICDYAGFTDEFENKLISTYKAHKW